MSLALAQVGCAGRQVPTDIDDGRQDVSDANLPANLEARLEAEFRPLIDAHNARIAKLDALESKGVVEVSFRDGRDQKREQLDVDLLLAAGGKGSLRLRKLSTDFACVGGDGRRSWIFDLRSKPASAKVFEALPVDVEAGAAQALASGEIEVLSPTSLRFMMGLTAIPADARVVPNRLGTDPRHAEAPDQTSAAAPADSPPPNAGAGPSALRANYSVSWTRSSVTTRMSFGVDGLASTLQLENSAGTVVATARLSAYELARVEGLSQLAWPMVATRFRTDVPGADAWAQFKITAVEAQSRRGKPRMFDLDALIGHYRPESVDYILRQEDGPAPAAGAPTRDPESTTP
ncbi:MAG: hypothetical protein ACKO3W_13960 [bacterium]